MSESNECPVCGIALTPDAPRGLCPPCLLQQGLMSDGTGTFDRNGPADHPTGDASVLAVLAGKLGRIPRASLRDPDRSGAPPPVVQPCSPEMPDPSSRCDRYQLLGEIARGGMGAILKGRDPDLGRDLAIKVLLERHRDRPEFVHRFVEEAQIGGQLQHPGVVPVYELGVFEDSRPYFAMKLVEGRTLAALLAARIDASRDRPAFLDIIERIAQTMAYAHARGVIHRDLKPSNIMVGNFGEVQVMDWGLAKVLSRGGEADDPADRPRPSDGAIRTLRSDSDADASRAGSVLGTPAYMAPEQARGDLALVDERADVFGLGAILCEVLTGSPPYVGDEAARVRDMASRAELGGARSRLASCGAEPDLIALCGRCLSPSPGDRPRDAGAVVAEITAYLRGMQERLRRAELERAEAQARASVEKARRRLAVGLAAAVIGLLATAGGSVGWWLHHRQAMAGRVDQLVRDITLLKQQAEAGDGDPARWAAAREAALHAHRLLDDARDPSTRARLAALSAEVTAGAEAAAADAVLLDRLAEIRESMDEVPPSQTEAEYAEAFAAAGLEIDALPAAQACRLLARRPARVASSMVASIDHWAALRIEQGNRAGGARLAVVAEMADTDHWRGRLRTALLEPDVHKHRESLLELAGSASAADLPPVTLALLGSALLRSGAVGAAEAVLRPAQRRYPDDLWLAQVLARTLEASSRPAEAIRYYLMARAVRPQSAHALAHALERQGEWEEAIAVFREAIRLKPGDTRHFACLEKALRSHGRTRAADEALDSAIVAAREALRHHPVDAMHHALLAIARRDPGRLDAIVAAYVDATRLEPDDASLHDRLGTILMIGGRADEAIAEFREASRLRPADPAARYNLGNALQARGRLDDAIVEYREAIRLRPGFAEAHCNLGAILCQVGRDLPGGQAELREAIRLRPEDALAHYNLGNALKLEGRMDEASAAHREAIRLDPSFARKIDASP